MSVFKSGAILLLLAIPFFVYGAWQIRSVTHLDLIVSDPPAEKGSPTKEQIASNKTAAEKWEGEIRTLESVTFQFRQPGAGDIATDSDCKALMKSISARSAELNDLELFLSERASPKFEGALKSKYEEWQSSKEKLARAAKTIEDWLVNSLSGVDSSASANQAVKSFEQLLDNYTKEGRFYDPNKAASWGIQARLKVIAALEKAAKEPFNKVLNLPLPLPAEADSPDVKKALGAPRAILAQVQELANLLRNYEDKRINLPNRVLVDAKDAIKRSSEWAAKEELLALFADPEPLKNPAKASDWIVNVGKEFAKTQTDSGRSLIRMKVQQFCAAFIPAAAKLDPEVLIDGNLIPRTGVTIEYRSDAKTQHLSDSPSGLNEFNFQTHFLNLDRIVWANDSKYTGKFDLLKPTTKSLIARDFTNARAVVTNWSVKELSQLKMKCEGEAKKVEEKMARHSQMDELVGIVPPGTPGRLEWTKANSKIWTRLTVLSDAMGKYPALFESGP
jgi:hypothetical protein